ncbi:MAG: hypothetical protein ACHQX1_02255 [Candidatus Micrarchaeales archaeon]
MMKRNKCVGSSIALVLMHKETKSKKQQAAVDFMVSYGIAILVVAIAVYVVLRLGIFSSSITQPTCVATPSFACGAAVLNSNGLLTFVLTQAIGGTINITAVACSSGLNVTGNMPQYGNVKVQKYATVNTLYPNNALQYGLTMYSGASAQITTNCYGLLGLSNQNIGQPYTGYIWINYTFTGLPTNYNTVQRVMQFSTRSA